ncbi:MAG: tRNA dihydrouridine synthase DusB [Thermodesulfobacteriota bacterium]|nr:tRNA dihydrouridine synthase DusB [Thermodesulfobacteriota bacterium]
MKIGPVILDNPFILAPLAGYTDLAFRLLCREMGAGLSVSEMISCHGLVFGQQKTLAMMKTVPEERPFAVQLFGNDPEIMGRAAAIVSTHPVDIIDINMGCPVRKVIKKGSGAALMKDFTRAEAIIRSVVDNTDLPVTIKFRSGWDDSSIVAPEFAAMAEAAGASAVTIHARTWAQMFGGRADRSVIARVKESVSIPVIGNGDILSHADGLAMMIETGCDAVMVGRGALGNPWVFRPGDLPDTLAGRLPVLLRHMVLADQHLDAQRLLFRIKNHACRYLTGLPGAAKIRQQITLCTTLPDIKILLENLAG